MGDNPKPTAVIELVNKSYSGGNLACTFSWRLNAMGRGSYWSLGVKLEYGNDTSVNNSLTIIPSGTRTWGERSGQVTIEKSNVFSTPQDFYFRLNSIQKTSGTPGSTQNYQVNVELASKIVVAGNFDIEGEHWINYQKYFDGYMDLFLWAWKVGNPENTGIFVKSEPQWWDGYRGNYASGEHTKFNSGQRAEIYKLAMPDTAVGTKVNFRYILKTYTGPGGAYVGEDSRVVQGTIRGNIKLKNGGTWKNCIPFVRTGNAWKPCAALLKDSGTWKDGEI